MNIIFVSPECYPFAKATSLADFVHKLAKDVESFGNNIKVLIPRYGCIDPQTYHIERIPQDFKVRFNNSVITTSVYKGIIPGSLAGVFLIESQNYFSNSKEIYLPQTDEERFKYFCSASLEVISKLRIEADIIHLFNPRVAHIGKLLRSKNIDYALLNKTRIVFTINDLNNVKGISSQTLADAINYPDIVIADSKTYANELLSGTHGSGINDLLKQKNDGFCVIQSGIDDILYNPETDSIIAQNYSRNYFSSGKRKCKEDLLDGFGLAHSHLVPLFGIVSLLSDENIEILLKSIPELASFNLNLVILAKGSDTLENELIKQCNKFKNIKISCEDNTSLARKIYAASDFYISTKKVDANGASILTAMRYGSIPIAYAGGAAKDIISDIDLKDESNGIFFKDYTVDNLLEAINTAIRNYKNKEKWTKIVKQAMSSDTTNLETAKKYLGYYEKVKESLNERTRVTA